MATTSTDILPIESTTTPSDAADVAATVRNCHAANTPIFPLGGQTALRYGLAPKRPGLALDLSGLNRVIDYPARDMTITVEAGITMQALAELMATERQRLPIDAAQASQATLGGVLATNWSGPRRYGQGTIRDYVIGISAVDGRGTAFKAGGRVVKNVAGYDFCKLLAGSLGTLAVITQLTLKVKPIPEATAFLACDLVDFNQAESLLASLVQSQTTPTAIELLAGREWLTDAALGPAAANTAARLAVGLEGTAIEVDWMLDRLDSEWREQGVRDVVRVVDDAAASLWERLTEFPTVGDAPLVLKANLLPSATTRFLAELLDAVPNASVQAHAGNGIVAARLPEFSADATPRLIVSRLQPLACAGGGNLVVLSRGDGVELTRQVQWGGVREDLPLMQAVKQAFDPLDLLNPGRFIY